MRPPAALLRSAHLLASLPLTALPAHAQAERPLAPPEGWSIVWQDEFASGPLPDETRWRYDTFRNRHGWYNSELQYYARRSPRTARVDDGRLVIEAHRGAYEGKRPDDWGGQRYSSARLTTRGLARWHTGFFEIRAKLPCVRGAWPAIWLLPDSHSGLWRSGEIDIVEMVGYQPEQVYHAVHTRDANFRNGAQLLKISRLDACGAFHDYQLLWTADKVTIGIDGVPVLTTDAAAFDRPMSLILNVAIGGEWAGAQGIDDDALPAAMEIEHVRIWQRKA